MPGHEIRIVDDAGRELDERREGRLEFRGPSATSGYFRNEAKTRELFRDGWLDSGDRAYMADGDVFITGRIKDIIIRAGQHIYPHEVEEAVGDIAGLIKGGVAVFGVADARVRHGTHRHPGRDQRKPMRPSGMPLKARARAAVTDILGSPPDDIVLVRPGTVPKTSSGKIRRAAAKEHYLAQQFDLPRRALRWQIARLWLAGLRRPADAAAAGERRISLCRRGGGRCSGCGWRSGRSRSSRCRAVPGAGRRCGRWRARPSLPWACRSPSRASSGCPNAAASWCSITRAMPTRSWWRRCCPASRPIWSRTSSPASSSPVPLLRRLGALFVDRHDLAGGLADTAAATALAREGRILVVFPEGTFTRQAGLLEFFTGAFKIASEAALPVYPGVLRGTRSMLRSDQWFPRWARIDVEMLDPVAPSGTDFASILRLRDTVRQAVLARCGEPDLRELVKPAAPDRPQ